MVVSDAGDAGPALVAYVVMRPAMSGSLPPTCASFWRRELPDYMIPARFVAIPTLPMTANGKLDKSALPAPAADNLLPNRLPATRPRQAKACEAKDRRHGGVAAGPAVGRRRRQFFMFGGHSMLGVQLVARIRDMFGVKLTLRQLFKRRRSPRCRLKSRGLIEASQ